MNISLQQAAKILAQSEDEVMYLHQQEILHASVDQESLAWQFDLDEVLKYKYNKEQETESLDTDLP